MLTVFTLASGRSGTKFLYELFRRNAQGCVCRHEPYFSPANPHLFGRPIYDFTHGNLAAIRPLLARKQQFVQRLKAQTYVETSHAFLKSYAPLAPEYFAEMRLVHLVRNPLKVAKSELNRENFLHRIHLPLRNYRGDDGRNYFLWALTGQERIFHDAGPEPLTPLQRYLVQWIEIENRAVQFLNRFDKHRDCYFFDSPKELNDPARVARLFEFLQIETRGPVQIAGSHNRTPGQKTIITDDDHRQFKELLARLPGVYLEIFRQEPYARLDWAELLRPVSSRAA